jgi:hypothetical protein
VSLLIENGFINIIHQSMRVEKEKDSCLQLYDLMKRAEREKASGKGRE